MKFARKTDAIVIAVLLAASLATWLIYRQVVKDKTPVAEIYRYSELVETVVLDKEEDRLFSVEGNPEVVFHLYEDGSIAFEQSDCPEKICIRAGKLHLPGQFAACLPNGLILKIVALEEDENDADIIVGN
jgi:hypothetical protein